MSDELMYKEVKEAKEAGQRALNSLYLAKEKLGSAKNWGLIDLFGGGFFTDVIKHSKISDASAYLEKARRDLVLFQRELQDVDVPTDIRIDIHSFLSFADFFFDGVIADYLVRSRISEAKDQVEDAIFRVEELVSQLDTL